MALWWIANVVMISVVDHLEPVPQLVTTVSLVNQTTIGLTRYGAALDRIL